jgi:hypothetical protein
MTKVMKAGPDLSLLGTAFFIEAPGGDHVYRAPGYLIFAL